MPCYVHKRQTVPMFAIVMCALYVFNFMEYSQRSCGSRKPFRSKYVTAENE